MARNGYCSLLINADLEMALHLYHCTNSNGLRGILTSMSFHPSYCLEKADYLTDSQNFAFAMVCFADLLDKELASHMKRFHSSAYLKMRRKWAIRKGVNPVCYYFKNTPFTAGIRKIIEKAAEENKKAKDAKDKEAQFSPFLNGVNIMMGYLKQYKGCYWMGDRWSPETIFFTEREWRYLPLVENGEAYFLPEEFFHNDEFRNEQKQILIEHGYVLRFSVEDIEEIGIKENEDIEWINEAVNNGNLSRGLLGKVQKINVEMMAE